MNIESQYHKYIKKKHIKSLKTSSIGSKITSRSGSKAASRPISRPNENLELDHSNINKNIIEKNKKLDKESVSK